MTYIHQLTFSDKYNKPNSQQTNKKSYINEYKNGEEIKNFCFSYGQTDKQTYIHKINDELSPSFLNYRFRIHFLLNRFSHLFLTESISYSFLTVL